MKLHRMLSVILMVLLLVLFVMPLLAQAGMTDSQVRSALRAAVDTNATPPAILRAQSLHVGTNDAVGQASNQTYLITVTFQTNLITYLGPGLTTNSVVTVTNTIVQIGTNVFTAGVKTGP